MQDNKVGQLKSIFTDIYENNKWHDQESKSGGGSTMDATKDIRKQLPKIIKSYNINSMFDCPCGDFNWMQTLDLSKLDYTGGDIVEALAQTNQEKFGNEQRRFIAFDLASSVPPKVDLIFIRDCFIHLDFDSILKAIANIKKSGSKYLLTTSYPTTKVNEERGPDETVYAKKFWNLEASPFSLPKPEKYIKDRRKNLKEKRMGLWIIDSL